MRKHLFAVLVATAVSAPAHALSEDEMTSGAAATVVLGEKCAPQQQAVFRKYVLAHLDSLSAQLPAHRREIVRDSVEMKVRAFTISSQYESCGQAEKLRAMAKTWGFARFFEG